MSGDTIFAQSTGFGRAAIAIIRISGPAVRAVLVALAGSVPEPRRATLRRLRSVDGGVLDQALVLFFPAPASETGEDLCEFQVHGGRAVVAAILGALAALPHLRAAEPGEFARRALINGKMDLLDLESLGDLLDADTEAQRRQALEGAGSLLRGRAESWRQQILEIRTELEAGIDFSDEGDVQQTLDSSAERSLTCLIGEMDAALASARRGEVIRQGFRVALVGPPNAGKSSLLNALAGRDVAIVSDIAGTTRDRLEVALDLAGLPVLVSDTAGLRDSVEAIEKEGIRRTRAAAAEADMILWLSPADAPCPPDPAFRDDPRVYLVVSKSDLAPVGRHADAWRCVSERAQTTIQELLEGIAVVGRRVVDDQAPALVTRARQAAAIAESRACLARALQHGAGNVELCCEDIRLGSEALSRLVGGIGVEEVLGAIFSRFCIGK